MVSMTIIPQDIIRDILCRLPTETLARFRCVSKEWLSLLSEPRFMQTHQKTLNRNHLIFWSNDGSLYSVPCKKGSTVTKLHLGCYRINYCIFGSVNGLVLAWAYRNLHKDYTLLVLNPTTKDYVELPISSKLLILHIYNP
ncbi:F-box associated interaction domain-containing protein [Artemisia annua]|uniref:F-box associated interaction domain-containing protein n=1 Tax=Artemisia annua TaxID=35608 RepID=A0A2U1QHP3_ARTAN|nr:F-box associated interaction domain-containing protein [Artemisia annua]